MSTLTHIERQSSPDALPMIGHGTTAEIERLTAQLQLQAAVIRGQRASLEAQRDTFERASEVAGIGLWECSLPDERLTWTGSVFDLFGLPRDTPLQRSRLLDLYTPSSRAVLQEVRSAGIARGDGFSLDAEIVTPCGLQRFFRVTATVDMQRGGPVRLFGIKRDITEQTARAERLRLLAQTDAVTGLANRARFDERLSAKVGTLLLIDLDGFKGVNDALGHAGGDACLKEAAARLERLCRPADLVARIGGDEFAVLIEERLGERAAGALARRIVEGLAKPITVNGRAILIGASVGIARGPEQPGRLFENADAALYEAKAAGRSTYRVFRTVPVS